MEKEQIISGLRSIVGEEQVLTKESSLLEAAKDYIGFRRYERCDGKYFVNRAACVVKAKNTQQVSAIMAFLHQNKVDVVPRTGGSCVTLGLEPVEGGVILDLSEMNRLLEFNPTDMLVRAECGMPLEALEKQMNEKGYTTGHFPQSLPMAQVGGLVSTRSIGQFSTLYGGIEDLVVGLEAILPDGEIIRIKNVPRRSVGPDLRHIFIGGEGSFGVVTEVTLKLFPYTPETRWMSAYGVKGMQNGLDLIRQIMVKGYKPAVVRLHDPQEVERLFGGICPEGYSLLLLLAEGPASITKAIGEAVEEIVAQYDVIPMGKAPVEHWLIHRNDVCQTLDSDERYRLHLVADTCEISANWSSIGKIYDAVVTRMPQEMENLAFIGGHSSHSYVQGTNIYFTFGFIAREDVKTVREDYMKLVSVIMEETLRFGGSIAHHHGSGKYRTQWMPQEHGSSYRLMNLIKNAVDPEKIMNKGVLFVE